MNPISFPEARRTLRAPIGHLAPDGNEIAPLPAYIDSHRVVSCWQPSWRERLSVLFFGRVWLVMLVPTQPPVYVTGVRDYFKADKAKVRAIKVK